MNGWVEGLVLVLMVYMEGLMLVLVYIYTCVRRRLEACSSE